MQVFFLKSAYRYFGGFFFFFLSQKLLEKLKQKIKENKKNNTPKNGLLQNRRSKKP